MATKKREEEKKLLSEATSDCRDNFAVIVDIIKRSRVNEIDPDQLINEIIRDKTILHLAVLDRSVRMINWILSEGRNAGFTKVLDKTELGSTALRLAVFYSFQAECEAIIAGCTPEERKQLLGAVENEGKTLLHDAVEKGFLKMIEWLLKREIRDAGFDKVLATTKDGKNALHLAVEARPQFVIPLLNAITDGCTPEEKPQLLNAVNNINNNSTLLHLTASLEKLDVVNWLLNEGRGAGFDRVLDKTRDGKTALHLAAEKGFLECCRTIVNALRVDNGEREDIVNSTSDNDNETILHIAARCNHPLIIAWMLSFEDGGGRAAGLESRTITALTRNERCSALHLAANADCVRALHSGCSKNERMELFLSLDSHGQTALHRAVRAHNKADVISELLSHPECSEIVDTRDHQGTTALHRAVMAGFFDEADSLRTNQCEQVINALLGTSLTTSESAAVVMVDPNVGIGRV